MLDSRQARNSLKWSHGLSACGTAALGSELFGHLQQGLFIIKGKLRRVPLSASTPKSFSKMLFATQLSPFGMLVVGDGDGLGSKLDSGAHIHFVLISVGCVVFQWRGAVLVFFVKEF